jgi:hypothetical protein
VQLEAANLTGARFGLGPATDPLRFQCVLHAAGAALLIVGVAPRLLDVALARISSSRLSVAARLPAAFGSGLALGVYGVNAQVRAQECVRSSCRQADQRHGAVQGYGQLFRSSFTLSYEAPTLATGSLRFAVQVRTHARTHERPRLSGRRPDRRPRRPPQTAFGGSPLVGSSLLGDTVVLEGANIFPLDLAGVRGMSARRARWLPRGFRVRVATHLRLRSCPTKTSPLPLRSPPPRPAKCVLAACACAGLVNRRGQVRLFYGPVGAPLRYEAAVVATRCAAPLLLRHAVRAPTLCPAQLHGREGAVGTWLRHAAELHAVGWRRVVAAEFRPL